MTKHAKADVMQGTLDVMVLKTLDTLGPTHGYGIARRIEQVSNDLLRLNQGTIYPALVRLQQRGWITSHWGESDNKRRANFYELTRVGRRHLVAENREVGARLMGREPVAHRKGVIRKPPRSIQRSS